MNNYLHLSSYCINWRVFLALCLFTSCNYKTEISFKENWDTISVLKNPHKGWYHHIFDNGIKEYAIKNDSIFSSFPAMDHLYIRLAWSFIEPLEGNYNWKYIDDIVNKYVSKGYGIAFRITCKETGAYPGYAGQQEGNINYATPVWVKKKGAKGVVSEIGGVKSWTPDWDDPIYLEKLDKFHQAFAARYDGKPWLRYIDVGSIGDWGEGHTSFSTKIPPTLDEVKANLTVYLKNYKKSLLVCTDDLIYYGKTAHEVKLLFDYTKNKGFTMRDDSPLVDYYLENYLKTWSVSHPWFFDSLYLSKPTIFELQVYNEIKSEKNWLGKNGKGKIEKYGYSGAELMTKAIETMHATYIGYHGYAEEWLSDNPELTCKLANRCGYWYFPVKAELPPKLSTGNNSITIFWLNKGVAPAYYPFSVKFRLEAENGYKTYDIEIENSGNRNWLPGIETEETYVVNIPQKIPKGFYVMKFKLFEKSFDKEILVRIGLKQHIENSDYYNLIERIRID